MSAAVQRQAAVVDRRVVSILPNPHDFPINAGLVALAQEHLQLAFGWLQQAQGYSGAATVAELGDAWLGVCARVHRPSTVAGYANNLRALAIELGRARVGELDRDALEVEGRRTPVAELEVSVLEQAIDRLPRGRWNSVTTALRAMVRWGNRHGFPGVVTLLPELRRHRARPFRFSSEDWSRAAHLLHEAYRAADPRSLTTAAGALCAVLWGVRRGAVARLEWGSVELDRDRLHVQDKGRARIVTLGEPGRSVLESLPRRGPFVFWGRGQENGHINPNSLTAHTRRVLRAGGMQLTLHQAGRHAAGCAIVGLGGGSRDVAAHLGHVDTRVTETCYLPPAEDTERARALLQAAWAKGGA